MQLAGNGADFVVEESLDERVDVFIGCAHCGAIRKPIGDAIEALEELRLFGRRQNPGAAQRVDPGFAREDVLRPEAMVDGKGTVQRIERLARPESEAPAPHVMEARVSLLGHPSVQPRVRPRSCWRGRRAG